MVEREKLESYILASLLQTNLTSMSNLIRCDDWQSETNARIHKMILDRMEKQQPINESMYHEPDLPDELISTMATLFSIAPYTDENVLKEKIDDLTERSDLDYAAKKMKAATVKIQSRRVKDVIDFSSNLIDDLTTRHPKQLETTIGHSMIEALKMIEKMKDQPKIKTGISQIDKFLHGGINQGEYIIFAARPNIGKSIFTLYPALATAENSLSVLMAVNEMSVAQTCIRMLANQSGVDINVIEMKRHPLQGDYDAIAVANDRMDKMPIAFKDRSYNLPDIETMIRNRQRLGKPVKLLVIDMAGRLKIEGRRYNKRSDEIADVSRNLQRIAQQYNCAVLATVQINRSGQMTEEPTLEHLKDSGAWEEDADKVFMMWSDKQDKDKRIIALRKNRTGRNEEKFYVTLDGCHMRFKENEQ